MCKIWILLFIFKLGFSSANLTDSSTNPVYLTTQQGTLKGSIDENYFGGTYYTFQSVPYAEPPVGRLRFQPPKPSKSWNGILDATKTNSICPQLAGNSYNGSENCLYLHVHTKSFSKNNLKPVMVWFHGGGFTAGSVYDAFGAEFLMVEDIVLVKVQYRLGQLGFLSINNTDAKIPGNLGLKDTLLALKWVQKNIRTFGGNPNQVTIFGQSAGGAIVHLHILSLQSRGLFTRAIIQSGYADIILPVKNVDKRFLELLHCDQIETTRIKGCLQNKSLDEIMTADSQINEEMQFIDTKIQRVGLAIEPKQYDAFISEPIIDIIKSGNFNQVPMIMGSLADDGVFALAVKPRVLPNVTNYERFVPIDLVSAPNSSRMAILGNAIKHFYYGKMVPKTLDDNYILYQTDNMFLRSIYQYAKLHLKHSRKPIYFYQFNYTTELNGNYLKYYRPLTVHSDDTHYLFLYDKTPPKMNPKDNDFIGVHRLVKFWTTFAISSESDPNPRRSGDSLIDVHWDRLDGTVFNYLDISPNMRMRNDLAGNRMRFWELIYKL